MFAGTFCVCRAYVIFYLSCRSCLHGEGTFCSPIHKVSGYTVLRVRYSSTCRFQKYPDAASGLGAKNSGGSVGLSVLGQY